MSKAAIILAAGAGTRMKSALPKVLHKIAGLPMLGHVIGALRGAGVERIVVVTASSGQAVRDYAKSLGCDSAIQEQQLGTGHAAACARDALKDFSGTLLIVNGDMPMVTASVIAQVVEAQVATFPPDVRWTDVLRDAQRAARDAGIGLWGPATPRP